MCIVYKISFYIIFISKNLKTEKGTDNSVINTYVSITQI